MVVSSVGFDLTQPTSVLRFGTHFDDLEDMPLQDRLVKNL